MRKNGFTLIELLAVIIILAIIALIATPIILNVVEDSKKSVASTEARYIVEGVNKYCSAASYKHMMDTSYTDPCALAESETTKTLGMEQLKPMFDNLSDVNAKTATVQYNGTKVTSATITSNGYTVTYSEADGYTVTKGTSAS